MLDFLIQLVNGPPGANPHLVGGIWGSLLGAGASLLGGILQNRGARDQASNQMAFQERMSGTSYQRGMKDMRKAGLNPILAYKQGGATSPAGSMAPVINPAKDIPQNLSTSPAAKAATKQTQASTKTTDAIRESTVSSYSSAAEADRSRADILAPDALTARWKLKALLYGEKLARDVYGGTSARSQDRTDKIVQRAKKSGPARRSKGDFTNFSEQPHHGAQDPPKPRSNAPGNHNWSNY